MTDIIKKFLRAQAWERAKGELRSIATIYMGEKEKYENYSQKLNEFIEDVDDNGLIE